MPQAHERNDDGRVVEDSKATFAVKVKRRTVESPMPQTGSDEEELERLAPSTVKKKKKASLKCPTLGPRLSASGVLPHDPVDLAAESSEDDHNLSLAERLASRVGTRPAAKSSFNAARIFDDNAMLSSDEDVQLKPPPAASLKPSPVNRKRIPRKITVDSSSDSDESALVAKASRKRKPLAASQKSNSMPLLSSSDSSDGEDDLNRKPRAVPRTKPKTMERQRLQKKQQQEQKKREREEKRAAKEREKLEKQQQRAAQQAAAREEKESKKRRRDEAAQAAGKHAKDEIAVLMERDLFRQGDLPLLKDLRDAGYGVLEYPSGLGCNVIQYLRKDFKDGGAQDAIRMLQAFKDDGYVHLPIITIVIDKPKDFIRLLERHDHDEDDDYPELMTWLLGVEEGWRAAWKMAASQRPRIILFLHQVREALDKLWIQFRKRAHRRDSQTPPTAEELHDATTWMLIEFNVECVHCSSAEDLSNHVRKMTRMLSEEPYQRQVTDLECVRKIKAQVSDLDPNDERATDCWLRQLQQIPSVSGKVASSIVDYYPTARSLWIAYQNENLSENQKRLLLAECCGTGRRNVKLSNDIFLVMTSSDPNEMLR